MLQPKRIARIFVLYPMGTIKKFLKKSIKIEAKEGLIETFDGKAVGNHSGIADYTIGQRKGIGVGGIKGINNNSPFYVIDIDKNNNKIIVGPKEKLAKYLIHLKEINFVSNDIPKKTFDAFVKVRSRNSLLSARIKSFSSKNKTAIVELQKPEFGVAPGQACVFYNKEKKMIGGGWIYSGEKNILKVIYFLIFNYVLETGL